MIEYDYLQVAARMNSKAGGKKLKSGDTVEYVICDDGSGLAATQRAYHVDEVRERSDLKVRRSCRNSHWETSPLNKSLCVKIF